MKENYKLRGSDFKFVKGYNQYNKRNPDTGDQNIDRRINDTAIFLAAYNSFVFIGITGVIALGLEKLLK